jgi:hypothetical protein
VAHGFIPKLVVLQLLTRIALQRDGNGILRTSPFEENALAALCLGIRAESYSVFGTLTAENKVAADNALPVSRVLSEA